MRNYAIRRALINIPVIWFVITLVFLATNALPGDFVAETIAASNPIGAEDPEAQERFREQVREELGLHRPVHERYAVYMADLARGEFGTSFQTRRPTIDMFRDGLAPTAQLGIMTFIVLVMVSIPIGVISAIRQDTIIDYVLRVIAITALAAPNFWVATIVLLYVVQWGLWDVQLTRSPLLWEDPWASFKLFIIPAVVGGFAAGAQVMRLLRSQMLEVLRQDYIRTAWSKGMRERTIIMRHALKNAFIPVLTIFGLTLATLIAGNVVFEYIFNINGIGNRMITAIRARDVPVLQTFILIIATFVVFVNLAIDLLYGALDPRIRFS